MGVADPAEEDRLAALHALGLLDTGAEERFDRVTRLCSRVFGVPMAAVTLIDRDRQFAKSGHGFEPGAVDVERSISFCDIAIRKPEMMVVPDAWLDERFAANPLVLGDPHIRFYAGQPLSAPGGHRVGTLCLFDSQPRRFTEADEALLRDLAAWVEKELVDDEEMERAADVQRGLLPDAPPAVAGYDIAGACVPSRNVGGDLFDWYAVADGVGLTVADVMGKGMPAAIMMATLRAVLRAGTRGGDLPSAVEQASLTMEADFGRTGAFATLFHAVLDSDSGRLRYIDAGHGLAVVRRADGEAEHPSQRGLPAGVGATAWTEGCLELHPGDAVVVYSDGLLDVAGDPDQVRLMVLDALAAEPTAADVVERLVAPARPRPPDDVTVVVVRRSA